MSAAAKILEGRTYPGYPEPHLRTAQAETRALQKYLIHKNPLSREEISVVDSLAQSHIPRKVARDSHGYGRHYCGDDLKFSRLETKSQILKNCELCLVSRTILYDNLGAQCKRHYNTRFDNTATMFPSEGQTGLLNSTLACSYPWYSGQRARSAFVRMTSCVIIESSDPHRSCFCWYVSRSCCNLTANAATVFLSTGLAAQAWILSYAIFIFFSRKSSSSSLEESSLSQSYVILPSLATKLGSPTKQYPEWPPWRVLYTAKKGSACAFAQPTLPMEPLTAWPMWSLVCWRDRSLPNVS